jgi:hypothetical protein
MFNRYALTRQCPNCEPRLRCNSKEALLGIQQVDDRTISVIKGKRDQPDCNLPSQ